LRLPFRFFSRRWEGKARGLVGELTKERRQRTPATVALVSEGLSAQKPIRLERGAPPEV